MMKIYTNDSFDKALEKVFYNFAEEPDKSLPVINDYIDKVHDIVLYHSGSCPLADEDIPRGFFSDDELDKGYLGYCKCETYEEDDEDFDDDDDDEEYDDEEDIETTITKKSKYFEKAEDNKNAKIESSLDRGFIIRI